MKQIKKSQGNKNNSLTDIQKKQILVNFLRSSRSYLGLGAEEERKKQLDSGSELTLKTELRPKDCAIKLLLNIFIDVSVCVATLKWKGTEQD